MMTPLIFNGQRILLTVHQFFPEHRSGTENLTLSVAHELIARGYAVRIYTAHPSDPLMKKTERFDEYEFEGIHVYRFHHAYTPMFGQNDLAELSYDNHLAAHYFQSILEQFEPDLVHFFHLNRVDTGLIDLALEGGIPAFMTPTDFWLICPNTQLLLCDGSSCLGPSPYAGNCAKHLVEMTGKGLTALLARRLPTSLAGLVARLTSENVLPPYPNRLEVLAISSRLNENMTRVNRLNGVVTTNKFITDTLVHYGLQPNLVIQSAFGIDVD